MAITPYVLYRDLDAAMKFLSDAFALRVHGEPKRGADGKANHAEMRFGHHTVMMGRPPVEFQNPKQLGHTTQCIYVTLKNVDKHFLRAREAGAVIIEDVINTEYGHRRYRAADPEGHEWAFAEQLKRD
jgi:uncharacterized glyoxalase superfamily protein PhnB